MKVIIRKSKTTLPKYNEIKDLLQKAINKELYADKDKLDFDEIRKALGADIPDGHIHQVAIDLGLEVEVD